MSPAVLCDKMFYLYIVAKSVRCIDLNLWSFIKNIQASQCVGVFLHLLCRCCSPCWFLLAVWVKLNYKRSFVIACSKSVTLEDLCSHSAPSGVSDWENGAIMSY